MFCDFTFISIQLTQENCENSSCSETAEQIRINDFMYTFSKPLEACAIYQYQIFEQPWNDVPSIDEKITTNEQFQNITLRIEQAHLELSSLNISWMNTEYLLCPKKYQIKVRENNEVKSQLVSTLLIETIRDLVPCVTYEISVYPIGSDNTVMEVYGHTENHTMNSVNPSGIQDLILDYSSIDNAIDISWTPPAEGASCIGTYTIEAISEVDYRTKNSTIPKENIPRVFACVAYTIVVTTHPLNSEIQAIQHFKEIVIPGRGEI